MLTYSIKIDRALDTGHFFDCICGIESLFYENKDITYIEYISVDFGYTVIAPNGMKEDIYLEKDKIILVGEQSIFDLCVLNKPYVAKNTRVIEAFIKAFPIGEI